MKKMHWYMLIAAFWLVLIFGFIGVKEFTLQTGEEVILKTRPVDPRDLFRGDYVILSYQISSVDLGSYGLSSEDIGLGDTLHVALDRDSEGFGIISGVSERSFETLSIRGKVVDISSETVELEYGIESYFVPEGQGYQIERQLSDSLSVAVVVDDFGNAVINSLLIDGEEVTVESNYDSRLIS
jgi:uncharacterized membrane-anchored protein